MSQPSAERRKLLYLLPFPPHLDASHGGSRVMAELLVRLAERHRVALLYFRAEDELPIDTRVSMKCETVREVARPTATTKTTYWLLRFRILYSFLQRKPIWATLWCVPAFKQELRSLVRRWRPDIVQFEYHIMAQYLSVIRNFEGPRILTQYETGVRAAWDLERTSRGYRRILQRFDGRVWKQYESKVLKEIDVAVVFTEQDRQALCELETETPIVRIPLQVTVPSEPLNPLGTAGPSVLFVGNFIHPPNVDAALHLAEDIFPLVQKHLPQARLYIVGDQPPARLRQMASEHILVTGLVLDVTPYLDSAAVVVAPLRTGGGMRVKVLEALAAGKAVVAYPLAMEGLQVSNGQHAFIASNDQEFVVCILELLSDEEKRRRTATAAYDWACQNISWQRSVTAYENLYADLLQDRSSETSMLALRDGV